MNFRTSFLVALRMLVPKSSAPSNARRSMFGAVACVALSLVPLVVVLVMTNGMIEGITARIIGLSSSHIQIQQFASYAAADGNRSELTELAQSVKTLDGVSYAFAEIQGVGLAAGSKGRTGAAVRAVDPRIFSDNTEFQKYLTVYQGSIAFPDSRSAVIGKKLAADLLLEPGSKMRLITARTGAGGKISPRVTVFTVTAVVSCGYQELDALWVFIPFEAGAQLFSPSSSNSSVHVEINEPFTPSLHETASAINAFIPAGYDVLTWSDLNTSEFENFASTKMLLLLIMSLIVLVAAVNVSSALVMLVMERRKEIAILKSIGASPGGITFTFLIIGTSIGACGLAAGIPLGLFFAVNINSIISITEKTLNFILHFGYNLFAGEGFSAVHLLDPAYYLEHVPVSIPLGELCIIAAVTMVLSLAVSAAPSIRAGREKPLSIFRKV